MLEARDMHMAQAQQAAALLQLQARHRAELQSMQLEIHLAEQPTYLPDMVVASTAADLISMVDASTCHYLVPGVGLLEAGVQTDALAFVCFEEEEEHVEEDEDYSSLCLNHTPDVCLMSPSCGHPSGLKRGLWGVYLSEFR